MGVSWGLASSHSFIHAIQALQLKCACLVRGRLCALLCPVLSCCVVCVVLSAENPDAAAADPSAIQHDFTSKLLHLAWHPNANLIACAASNSLYMYYA